MENSTQLAAMSVREFIELLASNAPAPGGGSASAVAGAMGIGLASMAAGLTVGKPKYAEHDEVMSTIISDSAPLLKEMTDGIDRDTDAFNGVTAVFRMPKSNNDEKAARKAALQEALKNAALVPFELLLNCEKALLILKEGVGRINPNCYSDLGSGAANLESAAKGAWLNVLINIGGLTDKAFAEDLRIRGKAAFDSCISVAEQVFNEVLRQIT